MSNKLGAIQSPTVHGPGFANGAISVVSGRASHMESFPSFYPSSSLLAHLHFPVPTISEFVPKSLKLMNYSSPYRFVLSQNGENSLFPRKYGQRPVHTRLRPPPITLLQGSCMVTPNRMRNRLINFLTRSPIYFLLKLNGRRSWLGEPAMLSHPIANPIYVAGVTQLLASRIMRRIMAINCARGKFQMQNNNCRRAK